MRAIVVGHLGQDGRLLSRLLAGRGYELLGVDRTSARSSVSGDLAPIDITRASEVAHLVGTFAPDEIYHLAAVHHSSEASPAAVAEETARAFRVNVDSVSHFLEAIRRERPRARFFHAASCHVFGGSDGLQDEATPLAPDSVYGVTKASALLLCRAHRAAGLHASSGILFNHESPLRGPGFLSSRVVRGALAIRRGQPGPLALGDLTATVDWGWAPDYVEAMTRITALPAGGEFVVATGAPHTVGQLVERCFSRLGLDWRRHVVEAPGILGRPARRHVGDASLLRSATGWAPTIDFDGMIDALLAAAESEAILDT